MVHYKYNPSIWEVETRVRDQPGLQNQKYYLKIKSKQNNSCSAFKTNAVALICHPITSGAEARREV